MPGVIGETGRPAGLERGGESDRGSGESSSEEQILENHVDHDEDLGFYS